MCNFLSAIVTREGAILHHPFTDSHTDLIKKFAGMNLNHAPAVRLRLKIEQRWINKLKPSLNVAKAYHWERLEDLPYGEPPMKAIRAA